MNKLTPTVSAKKEKPEKLQVKHMCEQRDTNYTNSAMH